MSVYSVKRKGWRYDFTLGGTRYTGAWFKTQRQAKEAEAKKRAELQQAATPSMPEAIQTDITFLELVNLRLDYIKAYKSEKYYADYVGLGRRVVKQWQKFKAREITRAMIQAYLIKRAKVSAYSANKDLRYLRALFNFGIKQELIDTDPTKGLEFMPVEKRVKYIPSKEDVAKVLLAADPETQDYLIAIKETLARVGEINRLTWQDVDFAGRFVILYTRKKKGGHLTPRKIPMTTKLYNMLLRRYQHRDKEKPWVFWQRYWSSKAGKFVEGPYRDRKRIMITLCRKAGVRYFRFHALRHFGASMMDKAHVPIGSIQRLLGHENRTTTEIYLHAIGDAERQAMAVFEQVSQVDASEESLTQTLTR